MFDEAQFQTAPVLKAALPWGAQEITTIWFLSSVASKADAPAAVYLARKWKDRPNEYVFQRLVLDNAGQIVEDPSGVAYGIIETYRQHIQHNLQYGKTKFGGDLMNGTITTMWYKRPADQNKKLLHEIRFAREYKRTEEFLAIANLPPHQDAASFEWLKNALGQDEFDAEIMSKSKNGDTEHALTHALSTDAVSLLCDKTRNRAQELSLQRLQSDFARTYAGTGTLWKDTRLHVFVLHDPANGGKDSDPVILTLCPRMVANSMQLNNIVQKRTVNTARSVCNPLDSLEMVVRFGFNFVFQLCKARFKEMQFHLDRL